MTLNQVARHTCDWCGATAERQFDKHPVDPPNGWMVIQAVWFLSCKPRYDEELCPDCQSAFHDLRSAKMSLRNEAS